LLVRAGYRIEQKMNASTADNAVQWLLLDLNAFFASCEQQENAALRGKPVIVVQAPAETAVAIAASYAAKAFGIKTGTLVREARRLCPEVIPVQANHRLYTDYHERILKAVDTCLPVEKVMSIDEMACRLMGAERQVPVAREFALRVKRALREQVGECLTCSCSSIRNGSDCRLWSTAVITASTRNQIRDLGAILHRSGEPLVIVNVAGKDHFRMTLCVLCGSLKNILHIGAAGVVIIGGVNRVV
jgi:impB/mucB/samB family